MLKNTLKSIHNDDNNKLIVNLRLTMLLTMFLKLM